MYLKIEDKESENFKRLDAYIEKRRSQALANITAVKKELGVDFTKYLQALRGYECVPVVAGIVPSGGESVSGMVLNGTHTGLLIPDKRTKRGRQISKFLKSLPNWSYNVELSLLPIAKLVSLKILSLSGKTWTLPFIERYGDTIIVRVDDVFGPRIKAGYIQISEDEFKEIGTRK